MDRHVSQQNSVTPPRKTTHAPPKKRSRSHAKALAPRRVPIRVILGFVVSRARHELPDLMYEEIGQRILDVVQDPPASGLVPGVVDDLREVCGGYRSPRAMGEHLRTGIVRQYEEWKKQGKDVPANAVYACLLTIVLPPPIRRRPDWNAILVYFRHELRRARVMPGDLWTGPKAERIAHMERRVAEIEARLHLADDQRTVPKTRFGF